MILYLQLGPEPPNSLHTRQRRSKKKHIYISIHKTFHHLKDESCRFNMSIYKYNPVVQTYNNTIHQSLKSLIKTLWLVVGLLLQWGVECVEGVTVAPSTVQPLVEQKMKGAKFKGAGVPLSKASKPHCLVKGLGSNTKTKSAPPPPNVFIKTQQRLMVERGSRRGGQGEGVWEKNVVWSVLSGTAKPPPTQWVSQTHGIPVSSVCVCVNHTYRRHTPVNTCLWQRMYMITTKRDHLF